MLVSEIYQFTNGGFLYKDSAGNVLSTGSSLDHAAPDTRTTNSGYIYTAAGQTLYFVADGTKTITITLADGTILTPTPTRAQLFELLSQYFFFELSGGGAVATYQQSLFTSFQRSAKTLTTLGIGSNSATAVGFVVDEAVKIVNSSIEITSFVAGNGTFAIHKVKSGLVTEQLFNTGTYTISANGVYTFATNLDLQPGIYAYVVQQTVIQTYRAFTLPDNVFGVQSTMGTTTFINTKTAIQAGIPDPFPVGQANGTGNAPLAVFEIQML